MISAGHLWTLDQSTLLKPTNQTPFEAKQDSLYLNLASLSALSFSVHVSPACVQTSMPLKWNCGSTVFALDVDPSGAHIVPPEGFQLKPVFLPQHFTLMSKKKNQC